MQTVKNFEDFQTEVNEGKQAMTNEETFLLSVIKDKEEHKVEDKDMTLSQIFANSAFAKKMERNMGGIPDDASFTLYKYKKNIFVIVNGVVDVPFSEFPKEWRQGVAKSFGME